MGSSLVSAANGYSHDNVINKLIKLNERIAVYLTNDEGKEKDLIWCQRLLTDVKDSGLVPDKTEFTMANLMWKKYNGGVSVDEKTIWLLIDTLLEDGTKIGAIKMYRRFINSSLREAKEVIDAREQKIKMGW